MNAINSGKTCQVDDLRQILRKHQSCPSDFRIIANHAYINACLSGHVPIIQLLTEEFGATGVFNDSGTALLYNFGLLEAIKAGHLEVIQMIAEKIADEDDIIMALGTTRSVCIRNILISALKAKVDITPDRKRE